ncbi:hypothetical protein Tco_1282579 [Tanacetum coccineum]
MDGRKQQLHLHRPISASPSPHHSYEFAPVSPLPLLMRWETDLSIFAGRHLETSHSDGRYCNMAVKVGRKRVFGTHLKVHNFVNLSIFIDTDFAVTSARSNTDSPEGIYLKAKMHVKKEILLKCRYIGGSDMKDDYQYRNPPREALHPSQWAFDETKAEVIQGLATQHPQEELFDLIEA